MAEDIGLLIKKIHNTIRMGADNDLREVGLTLAQMRVLFFLSHQPDGSAPQKQVEGYFCVKHPTMIGILHRLEGKGFVRVVTNPKDKRMRDVSLTAAGEAAVGHAIAHRRTLEETISTGFSPKERDELAQLLCRAYDNLLARFPKQDGEPHTKEDNH